MDRRPFIAWMPDGRMCIVNRQLADLLGVPAHSLIGRTIDDMIAEYWADPATGLPTLSLIRTGDVQNVHLRGTLNTAHQPPRPVLVMARTIELADRGWATAAFVLPETGDHSGVHAALDRLLVGIVDETATVTAIGGNVASVLGAGPEKVVGTELSEWVDVMPLDRRERAMIDRPRPAVLVRSAGQEASLLWARLPGDVHECAIAIQATPSNASRSAERVAELELRMSRIAAELDAAGLLASAPTATRERVERLATLTARQWDILSRLTGGMTPTEIAADLYVSPSTVRNHLSSIFRRFGVRSQVELLRLLGRS